MKSQFKIFALLCVLAVVMVYGWLIPAHAATGWTQLTPAVLPAPSAVSAAAESVNVATFTVASTAALTVGETIEIAGITPLGYDGVWQVATIPLSTTFTAVLKQSGLAAGAALSSGGTMTYVAPLVLFNSSMEGGGAGVYGITNNDATNHAELFSTSVNTNQPSDLLPGQPGNFGYNSNFNTVIYGFSGSTGATVTVTGGVWAK